MSRREEEEERERQEHELTEQIARKAKRRLDARRHDASAVWFWLGMFGLVGWSVAVPTVIGTAIGVWIDQRIPGDPSWTLTLMLVGVAVGIVVAWRWVREESGHGR